MKETLDLLLKLNLTDLDRIGPTDPIPENVNAFFYQLRADFKNLGVKGFDALATADKLLDALSASIPHEGISTKSMDKLETISNLFNGKGEIALFTTELYQAINSVIPIQQTQQIKSTIKEYYEYLNTKIAAERMDSSKNDNAYSPQQQKLLDRYSIINSLHDNIKNKDLLSSSEFKEVKEGVLACINKRPDWLERPFLQKLTDVLSLGFKPLYRAFFSTEVQLQNKLAKADIIDAPTEQDNEETTEPEL